MRLEIDRSYLVAAAFNNLKSYSQSSDAAHLFVGYPPTYMEACAMLRVSAVTCSHVVTTRLGI